MRDRLSWEYPLLGTGKRIGVMMSETTDTATHGVRLSDAAAAKIRVLLEQEGRDGLRLRVGVRPGGCSGVSYQLYFDDQVSDGDLLSEFNGVGVVVDRMSALFLDGVTIGFSDAVGGQGFTIDNPNMGGSCCG